MAGLRLEELSPGLVPAGPDRSKPA
jgi:hypothetical protein